MTIEEIELRVHEIDEMRADYEAAHAAEDALYKSFIEYVATLDIPLAHKAQAVLETQEIQFSRHCA